MDTPQMIALDDVVLRDDLDPRLGQRDDDLIAQYADIFDALPPIEIKQDNVLIDGWHRVRAAERAEQTEIAYVVVETADDDDLADKMWAANLKHGVQYTRVQRQTQGLKLHGRGLKAKDIAGRVGVSASSVYSWTKALREQEKQERDTEITRLRDEGMTQQEIADELEMGQSTVAEIVGDSKTGISDNELETVAEPAIETDEEETQEEPEAERDETAERLVEEQSDEPESELELPSAEAEMKEASAAEEESAALESATNAASSDEQPDIPQSEIDLVDKEADASEPEPEPHPPEPIPDDILNTARAVMVGFVESRPDGYLARLEVSASDG